MIKVESLCKTFGDVQAVKDISFTADNNLVTGLLGPNGAGKSTTLRILYGLLKQDSGEAFIDEFNLKTHRVAAQKRIGVLPDSHGLYTRLTARDRKSVV